MIRPFALRRRRRTDPSRWFGLLGAGLVIALAAVAWISYNALGGLPGQSKRAVWVELPSADHLNRSDEVRIAGLRVGQVTEIISVRRPIGAPYARVRLQLDGGAEPLRSTARASVLPSSVLGASYIRLDPGLGGRPIPVGGTLPLSRGATGTQLTDLLDIFQRSTAGDIRSSLGTMSAGLAGRGEALNTSIARFGELLPPLSRVARTLSAPDAGLARFLVQGDRASAVLQTSSPELASLVTGGARTFGALAAQRAPLEQTLVRAPPAERATRTALTRVQPGLDATARVLVALEPAAELLPGTLRTADRTLRAGRPALEGIPPFAGPLGRALRVVRTLTRAPSTGGGIRKTTELLGALDTTVAPLADAQQQCNLLALWAENFSRVFGQLGEGAGPAIANIEVTTVGAQSETLQSAAPAPDLANNFYARNDKTECESGNEPFTGAQQLTNPPGLQPDSMRSTAPIPGALERARDAGLLDPEPR